MAEWCAQDLDISPQEEADPRPIGLSSLRNHKLPVESPLGSKPWFSLRAPGEHAPTEQSPTM